MNDFTDDELALAINVFEYSLNQVLDTKPIQKLIVKCSDELNRRFQTNGKFGSEELNHEQD